MAVPHDVLTRLLIKHQGSEALNLAEHLVNFKEHDRILIEKFNFYEIGPRLIRVNFAGIYIRNCSFEAMEIKNCVFKGAIFEAENRYQESVCIGETPSDYKKIEYKEVKSNSKTMPFLPSAWEKLLLLRCPEKLFQFNLIRQYRSEFSRQLDKRTGICFLSRDKEWYFFHNIKCLHPHFKAYGCKLHVLVKPSDLQKALTIIGSDLFKLGAFKVIVPEKLESFFKDVADVKKIMQSRQFAISTDEKLKEEYREFFRGYKRNNHITVYLFENADGLPQWDVACLKDYLSGISEKLRRADIKASKKPTSDAACFSEYFSLRMDRGLDLEYIGYEIVGSNYNPANIPHPYQALLCQRPAVDYSLSASLYSFFDVNDDESFQLSDEFNAKKHFEKFKHTAETLPRVICLTLQACLSVYLKVYRYLAAGRPVSETEFCGINKEFIKLEYQNNSIHLHRIAILYFYLNFCLRHQNDLNMVDLDIDFIDDPFIFKLSALFEATRRKLLTEPAELKAEISEANNAIRAEIIKRLEKMSVVTEPLRSEMLDALADLMDDDVEEGREILGVMTSKAGWNSDRSFEYKS